MTDLSTGGSMRSSVIKLAGQDLLRVVHGHFWAVPSPCRRSAWGVKTAESVLSQSGVNIVSMTPS
jgi:hypothetical protein